MSSSSSSSSSSSTDLSLGAPKVLGLALHRPLGVERKKPERGTRHVMLRHVTSCYVRGGKRGEEREEWDGVGMGWEKDNN